MSPSRQRVALPTALDQVHEAAICCNTGLTALLLNLPCRGHHLAPLLKWVELPVLSGSHSLGGIRAVLHQLMSDRSKRADFVATPYSDFRDQQRCVAAMRGCCHVTKRAARRGRRRGKKLGAAAWHHQRNRFFPGNRRFGLLAMPSSTAYAEVRSMATAARAVSDPRCLRRPAERSARAAIIASTPGSQVSRVGRWHFARQPQTQSDFRRIGPSSF